MFDLIWHVFFFWQSTGKQSFQNPMWTIAINEREREIVFIAHNWCYANFGKNIYIVPSWLWFRIMMILDYRISPFEVSFLKNNASYVINKQVYIHHPVNDYPSFAQVLSQQNARNWLLLPCVASPNHVSCTVPSKLCLSWSWELPGLQLCGLYPLVQLQVAWIQRGWQWYF